MTGTDLATLLVWQSSCMTPRVAFAFGLLLVYAAKTIFAFSEVAAAALFLPQNNSTIFWDVVTRQLAPFEGGLELQSRL